mmetsp:Transcript_31873/g.52560  ORF Transcript_31873/g.52560 Transcript_31873/m.52560 type:complete len:261 (-) Transcript_31873:68-850(-)|eukprot:CAMPEP_0119025022 /NCGR_PEP_ID=MMETSP1176-20130426/33002_1 /TAXON_ID=265551 /ORGANISM="Synedropsis recta cf, Strain CCMP1620" /LENGTH=260 /DNA_ID=CAMNT_0006980465 /DNA_START=35 /DNA_END=817 /DNA_ORIENTATION=+
MLLVACSLRRIAPLAQHHRRLFSSPAPSKKPSLIIRAWNSYSESLYKRPLTTKCTAAAIIFFTSDSATQYLMREDKDNEFEWDASRAISGAIFGIVATSYLHVWWNGLEIICERIMPVARSKIAHTAIKVFIDQALGAPLYIYMYYNITNFVQMAAAGDKAPLEAWNAVQKKANEMWWPTMLRHWQLWPVVHSFNFYYVPLHHRVLIQNLVLVGWSGYLSHLNNGGLLTPKDEVEVTVEVQRRTTVRKQQADLARKLSKK